MPKPVPFVLVVKKGSKMRCLCSGVQAWAVVAEGDSNAGCPSISARVQRTMISTGSGTGGQGVFQDIAEDLPEPELVDEHRRVQSVGFLEECCLLALASKWRFSQACRQMCDRFHSSNSSLSGAA